MITLQGAKQLHAHLHLNESSAVNVLEVAAGTGLGSQDVIQRLLQRPHGSSKSTYTVTDLSPDMVTLARENLQQQQTDQIELNIVHANGQDLCNIPSASIDRYILNMFLHRASSINDLLREAYRVLKSDAIAGFTIWGRPEKSGLFMIDAEINQELGLSDGSPHPNFSLGSDLENLRRQFTEAGFGRVRIWSYLCVTELWSGKDFADLYQAGEYVFELTVWQDTKHPSLEPSPSIIGKKIKLERVHRLKIFNNMCQGSVTYKEFTAAILIADNKKQKIESSTSCG